jgi:arginyl-tRNA--protein-N-Asp/Glu arginylyltransferase
MTRHQTEIPQFFLTAPAPCPYLPGREERKVFTYLVGERAAALNDILTQGGFRRSQNIAYRPACETCNACVSIRIVVDAFVMTRGHKRVRNRNRDLIGTDIGASPSSDQYALFCRYLGDRHSGGGMADMTMQDYAMMVGESHVETLAVEYRFRGIDSGLSGRGEGPLVAMALTDVLADGLSMVYSFFDPDHSSRSLGTMMVLDHIERARRMGLPYVYLGYWVHGSPKMEYKSRFRPHERLSPRGWERVAD